MNYVNVDNHKNLRKCSENLIPLGNGILWLAMCIHSECVSVYDNICIVHV